MSPEEEPWHLESCLARVGVRGPGSGAGLVTEGGYVCSALLALGSPAREDDGAGQVSEQPGESELLPPRSQPQPGCPHPRQVRLLAPRAVPCCALWAAPAMPLVLPALPLLLAGCAGGSRVEGATPASIPQLGLCPPPSASVSKVRPSSPALAVCLGTLSCCPYALLLCSALVPPLTVPFSQGVCLCVLPAAGAVEPAGRCCGEKEETFQFRAAAALHPLAAAQPRADPGTGVSLRWA